MIPKGNYLKIIKEVGVVLRNLQNLLIIINVILFVTTIRIPVHIGFHNKRGHKRITLTRSVSSFELLFDRYCKIPNLTKSFDVVLIRHNDNTGSSSITTKGESRRSSSINDESGESLVDTTLSILKMLLLGHKRITLTRSVSSFELLFDRYCKIPNLTKSFDVVLIRHNDNTGSSSISTKDESCPSSSINDESGESLVDTTLSILKMLLLGASTLKSDGEQRQLVDNIFKQSLSLKILLMMKWYSVESIESTVARSVDVQNDKAWIFTSLMKDLIQILIIEEWEKLRAGYKYNTTISIRSGRVSDDCPKFYPYCGIGIFICSFLVEFRALDELQFDTGERGHLRVYLFCIFSSLELLFERFSKKKTLSFTKSADVVLIWQRNRAVRSPVNSHQYNILLTAHSGKSLVDTTLSSLKTLLPCFIISDLTGNHARYCSNFGVLRGYSNDFFLAFMQLQSYIELEKHSEKKLTRKLSAIICMVNSAYMKITGNINNLESSTDSDSSHTQREDHNFFFDIQSLSILNLALASNGYFVRVRFEFKFDVCVVKMIEEDCLERCPCSRKNKLQEMEHYNDENYFSKKKKASSFLKGNKLIITSYINDEDLFINEYFITK
ncbi:hypothetical protein H8356DRAFT_1435831 [Neocallimastix lanati (nom. inval.)]|nr:hypothetical protein H8356DRAFT_1435831 [Neocallimastix sp. JGI-2020a]